MYTKHMHILALLHNDLLRIYEDTNWPLKTFLQWKALATSGHILQILTFYTGRPNHSHCFYLLIWTNLFRGHLPLFRRQLLPGHRRISQENHTVWFIPILNHNTDYLGKWGKLTKTSAGGKNWIMQYSTDVCTGCSKNIHIIPHHLGQVELPHSSAYCTEVRWCVMCTLVHTHALRCN